VELDITPSYISEEMWNVVSRLFLKKEKILDKSLELIAEDANTASSIAYFFSISGIVSKDPSTGQPNNFLFNPPG
jgi:hypothetical protein